MLFLWKSLVGRLIDWLVWLPDHARQRLFTASSWFGARRLAVLCRQLRKVFEHVWIRPAQLAQPLMFCLTETSSKRTRHRITRMISTPGRHFDIASHRQIASIRKFHVRKSNVPRAWFSPACFQHGGPRGWRLSRSRQNRDSVRGFSAQSMLPKLPNPSSIAGYTQSSRFQTIQRGRSCQPRRRCRRCYTSKQCSQTTCTASICHEMSCCKKLLSLPIGLKRDRWTQMVFQRLKTHRNQVPCRDC